MKAVLLLALLFWRAVPTSVAQTADPHYFRYERSVAATGAGQACAVLDAQTFAHAAASLKDIRLYEGIGTSTPREVPYAITLSQPVQPDNVPARVVNLGFHSGSIVFDLEMPPRPYTEVMLDLAGQDYIATASVSGSNSPGAAATNLGEFTLFDLTSQHLSRNKTLHLQESTFPWLHVVLTASPAPGTHDFRLDPKIVRGASVPPSREAQILYAPAAQTSTIVNHERQSIATFTLPQRVPVERITFDLAPTFTGNFSRDVRIYDRPEGAPATSGESLSGTILRVHLTQGGREIRQEELSVPATIGSNLQNPATVEVVVENGDDIPLPITAVRLEMRERNLCFNAPSAQPLVLYYGDPVLDAPIYDFARLFSATAHTTRAQLGAEQMNPDYQARPDTRPITERYPDLLWIALLAVICSLGFVAIRAAKTLPR
ncbi:hypothetical protein GCM10011507_17610 [Edaphobacter acidisoli]|uniref:DUF3999 domain-containing protein n=1 Tax=Edaphobacter acidisoli TaxID=2040573 RepID=A0A916RRX9_9BACT|nr:DUF3999 family protein [Edaphobacter acidisoli]GGA66573.1 hypothetical protein GCM10011507_17610 [Edaphobacter acidisoli]